MKVSKATEMAVNGRHQGVAGVAGLSSWVVKGSGTECRVSEPAKKDLRNRCNKAMPVTSSARFSVSG